MTSRALTYLLCAVVGVTMLCIGGLLGLAGAASTCHPTIEPSTTDSAPPSPDPAHGYNAEQLTNAEIITSVGISRGIPTRGHIIAVAAAIQESSLHNLGNQPPSSDYDSLGLFAQHPSQGWGTPAQLTDPVYAAGKFYDHLITVAGWQQMPLTRAAQAVQHSAHPDAYATWEPDATTLVALTNAATGRCDGGDGMSDDGLSLPANFNLPADTPDQIAAAITWALQQLGTPYAFGGSCTDAHSGDPATQCDCSSLVQQAYAKAGVSLPRTTEDQQNSGTPVASPDLLLPGDLIFIPGSDGTMADPGHVGLYLGQNLILQAPHTGDVVKISTLDSWRAEIAKIRRVVAWPSQVPS